MFARKNVLPFFLPFFISQALGQSGGEYGAIQLDVKSQDSIKSAARSLAGGIIAAYNDSLASEDGGIPGLFDGKNDIYFWESGTLWNALLGYSYLTGDSQYDATISEALQFQLGDYDAFMPPNQTKTLGNDDQSCWALSAMTAAEIGLPKPKDAEWVDYARNVWQIQSERLGSGEDKCAGGLRWQIYTFNAGYNYMNAWSNGNFFLLSSRLAKFTGNATYSQYADKIFKWSQTVGLVDKDFSVYDGTDSVANCSEVSKLRWTATHGLYTEGAALMYNIVSLLNFPVYGLYLNIDRPAHKTGRTLSRALSKPRLFFSGRRDPASSPSTPASWPADATRINVPSKAFLLARSHAPRSQPQSFPTPSTSYS